MSTYSIVRFFEWTSESEVMQTGLTLEEAQEHCKDPDTRGFEPGKGRWFDGYREE